MNGTLLAGALLSAVTTEAAGDFLPGGPDLSALAGFAGPVRTVIAVLLGIAVIGGLIVSALGLVTWVGGAMSDAPIKIKAGQNKLLAGVAIMFVSLFLFVLIINAVLDIGTRMS